VCAPEPAPDKLADLVDFVALRFAQLRPEGDPSVVASQLVQQYAFEKSGTAARLHTLDADYSSGRAAALIDRAYLSADGVCDGQLEERRAMHALQELTAASSGRQNRGASLGSQVAGRVEQRMITARYGVELCRVHLGLVTWLRSNSNDGASPVAGPSPATPRVGEAAKVSQAPSTPWRDVDTQPGQDLLELCLDAAEVCDRVPDPAVIEQSRCVRLIRRDLMRVRRSLPLVAVLRDLGRDPSLKPANAVWANLLRIPEQEYEHQLVAAVRSFNVHKMCLGRVLQLLNEANDVRGLLSRHAEVQAARDAEQRASEQQAAAAVEKKRQEEERRAAASTASKARKK
jgi:hypothetical protein